MGNMNNLFKQLMKEGEIFYAMKHNGLRFRTFHVVKEHVTEESTVGTIQIVDCKGAVEIGRVTVAFWPKEHGKFGEGQVYEVAFSFCAGIDLHRYDHDEGEVRAYLRLLAQNDVVHVQNKSNKDLPPMPREKLSGRAKHEFIRSAGQIKDQLKSLVFVEATRRGVPWLKDVLLGDLK